MRERGSRSAAEDGRRPNADHVRGRAERESSHSAQEDHALLSVDFESCSSVFVDDNLRKITMLPKVIVYSYPPHVSLCTVVLVCCLYALHKINRYWFLFASCSPTFSSVCVRFFDTHHNQRIFRKAIFVSVILLDL